MMQIEDMKAKQLDVFISEYNWDNGFRVPQIVVNNANCELATALKIFYLADGYSYLLQNANDNMKWIQFICPLYDRILTGCFAKGDLSYKIPLTKVQKYKLKAANVSEIFVTDI